MPEPTGTAVEAVFRANKHRKIYRKRNVDDQDDSGSRDRDDSPEADSGVQGQRQRFKRPLAKKHGIGFSTAGSKLAPDERSASQTAVVPFQPGQDEDRAAHDRFVKPAVKAEVIEDKHLTAYVDSKLAELRTSSSVSTADPACAIEVSASVPSNERGPPHVAGLAAEKDSHIGQKGPHSRQRVKPARTRRGPPQRDADTIARDAIVDQIMRESEFPLYAKPSSRILNTQPEGLDADEAAAEAFRADFLFNLKERRNRRRPAAPSAQQRGAPRVPTGPKLGGSRAQRGKMKAIEKAKATGQTVDEVLKRR